MSHQRVVVVGVDGSAPSRTALAYALRNAIARDDEVRAVVAVDPPQMWATPYGVAAITPPGEQVDAARRMLAMTVDEVTAEIGDDAAEVTLSQQVEVERAAQVLLTAAEGADELVVGHRGRGAFASTALGSVGLHCVLHAPCPVIVVRPPVRVDLEPEDLLTLREG